MKKLLLVIDYQVDFVNGALGFKGAERIEDFIINKIKEYEEDKQDVVFTLDTHEDNYLDTIEGKKLPIPHCIKYTSGHEIYGKVKELSKNHKIIEKDTFGSKKLVSYFKFHKYDEIEIVGLVSNICVFSNAVITKSCLPNSKITVLKKGTSSNDIAMQEKSFEVLKNLHIEVE